MSNRYDWCMQHCRRFPMPQLQTAKLLRIYIAESSRRGSRPLYEAIVEKCRECGAAGATVMRGTEGFGCGPEIHRSHLLSHYAPVEITIVDEANKIDLF